MVENAEKENSVTEPSPSEEPNETHEEKLSTDSVTDNSGIPPFRPDRKDCQTCENFQEDILSCGHIDLKSYKKISDDDAFCPVRTKLFNKYKYDYWDLVDKTPSFSYDSADKQISFKTQREKNRIENAKTCANKEGTKWYDSFEPFILDTFSLFQWDGQKQSFVLYCRLLRWDGNRQEWYRYSEAKGIWEIIQDEEFNLFVIDWAKYVNVKTDDAMFSHAKKRLKSVLLYKGIWDSPDYINCLNGVYHIPTRTLIDFDPNFNSIQQFPVIYLFPPERQPTPIYDKICAVYPTQMQKFESVVHRALFQDFSDEMWLLLVGNTNTGKGTVLQIIQAIFGKLCEPMGIQIIGQRFGLAPLVGKRVLLDREMSSSYFPPDCLKYAKDLVTHEGTINLEDKHKRRGDEDLRIFIIGATNVLGELPPDYNKDAWFRRLIMVIFDKIQDPNPQFKADLKKEINEIFSKIVDTNYPSNRPNTSNELIEYGKKMNRLWDDWADPVRKICFQFFKKASNPKDLSTQIDVEDCWRYVMDELDVQNIMLKEKRVKGNVTQSLELLGIKKKQKMINGKRSYRYYGIEILDNDLLAKRKEEIEDEEASHEDQSGSKNKKNLSEPWYNKKDIEKMGKPNPTFDNQITEAENINED
jgi:hypothetical protein